MSIPAPQLTPGDIQLELGRIFQKKRRDFVTAIYGSGEAATVFAADRKWEVIPTRSELDLRAHMPLPGAENDPGRVFLVDWTERPLPLDLSCRLAGGRVFQISRGRRLAGLFGSWEAEAGLMDTGLAAVLLSGEVTGLKKVSGLRLTRHDAVRHFLHAWARFPLTAEITPARLATWCLDNDASAALAKKAAESEIWQKLAAELRVFIEKQAGLAAAMVWKAWEQNQVRRFIEVAVLVDAHNRTEDPIVEGLLQGRLTELAPGYGVGMLEARQCLELDQLLSDFFEANEHGLQSSLLQSADGLIPYENFAATRAGSPWLPLGHATREGALAAALDDLVLQPDAATFASVLRALEAVESHHLDESLRPGAQRETRRMAARLAAWLVHRAQEPGPGPGSMHQPAIDLAQKYAAEGGFVDWCRGRLHGPLPFQKPLEDAIHRVRAAADAARRTDDERFAHALLHWYEAGKPSGEVLPIEDVTRRFVADMLSENAERRILVILMDGMSWETAVQLLSRLEGEQWAPVLWRPKGHQTRPHFPPVLAALPTLTNVSRAAFFTGRLEPRAGDKATQYDADRWAANTALARANDHAALPPLVLRSDLMCGESLQDDVKKAVDSSHRVVGVVVNAIDEALKGSNQIELDYSQVFIKPLGGLLSAAAGAERIVLLCSDHGHVLGDAMKPHGLPTPKPLKGGKRWRTLGEGEAIQPFELELPAKTWCPSGAARVAAIWDGGVCHSHPGYGEHGGLSLAEVVAPTLLIAPEWLAQLKPDDHAALETRPFPLPRWWDLEISAPRGKPVATEQKKPTKSPQQSLLPMAGIAPPPAPEPQAQAQEPPLVLALRASKIFKANVEGRAPTDVEQVLRFLSVIVDAGGKLGDQEFARRCETRPHRVAGLVARMGTILNIDGYAMIEHDRGGRQILLHKTRLVAQYGVAE